MKLSEIFEHEIVSKDRLDPKTFWTIPKMDKVEPPFTKNAFSKLIDVTGGDQIEDPAGGKVLKKSNTMKYGEFSKPQRSRKNSKDKRNKGKFATKPVKSKKKAKFDNKRKKNRKEDKGE